MIGELLPDQPALDNPGVLQAVNVTPYANGYRPTRVLVTQTNALTGPCLGAALLEDSQGVTYNYAGDATTIYNRQGTTYSALAGTYALTSSRWEFDRFYDKVLAVNGVDRVQYGDFGVGLADADAGTTPGTAPIGFHMATARNYVMVGDLIDNGQGLQDAAGVSWSALGDPTNWTTGESGYQHLDGAGKVIKLLGGEYFTLMMEDGIYRATSIGPPAYFQFDLIVPSRPVPYSGAVVQVGYRVFFLSYDGFYVFDGVQAVPISSEKMAQTFFDDFDRENADLMTSEADLENNLVYFAYPGAGHAAGLCNKAYVFNYVTGMWTGPIEQETQQLIYSRYPGVFSDTVPPGDQDVDTGTLALAGVLNDDPQFLGGIDPILGAFIPGNTFAIPAGPKRTALIESGEYAHTEGGYTLVTGFRPFVDGNDPIVRGKICYRNETYGDLQSCQITPINPRTGSIDQRVNARYHRYFTEVSGDFDSIHGGQPMVVPGGRR